MKTKIRKANLGSPAATATHDAARASLAEPPPSSDELPDDLSASLSLAEAARLAEFEDSLARLRAKGFEEGRILREIRDRRLYRENHATFEIYVEQRWDYAVRNAQHLMAASDIYDMLKATGIELLPVSPAQVRPLGSLETSEQVELWRHLTAANTSVQRITRTAVENAVTTWPYVRGLPLERVASALSPWPADAEGALKEVPAKHRTSVRQVVLSTDASPTARLVQEVFEAFGAHGLEGGEVQPLAGTARAQTAARREVGLGKPAFISVEDLGVLSDEAPDNEGVAKLDGESHHEKERDPSESSRPHPKSQKHPSKTNASSVFLGASGTRPLLVSVPRVLLPASMLKDVPERANELIVDIAELERIGGPVRDGIVDLKAIREAARETGKTPTFNVTNEHVDWARRTVNPLTGCRHACRTTFCYASGIAQRLFAQGFLPTL